MASTSYFGECSLCGTRVSKGGMTRHLGACAPAHDRPRGKPGRLFRLRVEGAYLPEYWLDVEAKAGATLYDLDAFLREIWVECCGHLSAFHIGEIMYCSPPGHYPREDMPGDRSMNARLDRALVNTARFVYDYDFGTTTRLVLRVSTERQGAIGRDRLRLLACNEPPVWPCGVCGKPATRICTFCTEEDQDPLCCDAHATNHPCGDEGFLPVVNSPRMGMCGYTGELW